VQEVCELVATGLSDWLPCSACGVEAVAMTTTKKTGAKGLERERVRRRKLELSKIEHCYGRTLEDSAQSDAPELTTTGGAPAASPTCDPCGVGATGVRQPGQRVTCVWCGKSVTVKARGPLPKFCSSNCRHRAWEQERATQAGRAAVVVVDRTVTAYPGDVRGWVDHLDRLAQEISTGQLDVDLLKAAIDNVSATAEERQRRRRTGMWTPATIRCW
jgi:hypothetical protein